VLNRLIKLNILDYRTPFSGQTLKKDNLSKPMIITYFSIHTYLFAKSAVYPTNKFPIFWIILTSLIMK